MLNELTNRIENELNSIALPFKPEGLYEPLRYFIGIGGKRIRPALTLMATSLFGADPNRSINQAIAIELFHNFSLIHDDIMDQAPLRRGMETVHQKWDVNTAILSGDVLLIEAYKKLITGAGNNPLRILDVFNKTAVEVCEGQQLDMDFESRMDVSVAEYIEMIRLKTSVLLGCALKIGAYMAEADEKDAEHLYQFGVHVGLAFQIKDDLLDLYADPEKFGKQVGGDVIANKKTLLYLTATGLASKDQLAVLRQLSTEKDPILKIEKTKILFDHLNVKSACEDMMDEHLGHAMYHLEEVSTDDQSKKSLRDLAIYLINRDK
jgi:geranylgeranyl diphosphate synthase, type II